METEARLTPSLPACRNHASPIRAIRSAPTSLHPGQETSRKGLLFWAVGRPRGRPQGLAGAPKDDLLAAGGKAGPVAPDGLTVQAACDQFFTAQESRVGIGEPWHRNFDDPVASGNRKSAKKQSSRRRSHGNGRWFGGARRATCG
jgi:hypothetical protein